MRDVPDRLVLDFAALPIGAAQQMRDVLPPLPLTPIGDNVNRTLERGLLDMSAPYRHHRTDPQHN